MRPRRTLYRVYLKRKTSHGSEVDPASRTTTPSPAAAEAAYRELLARTDFSGQPVAAVLSLNSRHLMYHRFDRGPGDADYVAPDAEIQLYHDDQEGQCTN